MCNGFNDRFCETRACGFSPKFRRKSVTFRAFGASIDMVAGPIRQVLNNTPITHCTGRNAPERHKGKRSEFGQYGFCLKRRKEDANGLLPGYIRQLRSRPTATWREPVCSINPHSKYAMFERADVLVSKGSFLEIWKS